MTSIIGHTCQFCGREGAELNSDYPPLCRECWTKLEKNEIKLSESNFGQYYIGREAEKQM